MDDLLQSKRLWVFLGGALGLVLIIVLAVLVFTWGSGDEEPVAVEEPEGGGELTTDSETVEREETSEEDDDADEVLIDTEEPFVILTDEPVITANLSRDGYQLQYVADTDQTLYSLGFNGGTPTKIQTLRFVEASETRWSPDRVKLSLKDGELYKIYNFDNQVEFEMPADITAMDWIDGTRFAYKVARTDESRGNISIGEFNDSGSWDPTRVWDIDVPTLQLATIYNQNYISFYPGPNGAKAENLQVVDTGGTGTRNLVSKIGGLEAKWSGDGQKGVYTSTSVDNPEAITVHAVNNDGSRQVSLNIPTFISKVAWGASNKTLYIARPDTIPGGVILPNDYYLNKFRTADSFWKIDLEEGTVSRIITSAELGLEIDAMNLFTSLDEKYLFFINKPTGGQNDGKIGRLLIDNAFSSTVGTVDTLVGEGTDVTVPDDTVTDFTTPEETPSTGAGSIIIVISLLVGAGAVFIYLGYNGTFSQTKQEDIIKEKTSKRKNSSGKK